MRTWLWQQRRRQVQRFSLVGFEDGAHGGKIGTGVTGQARNQMWIASLSFVVYVMGAKTFS